MRFIQPAVLFDVCPNIGVSISYFVLDKGYTLTTEKKGKARLFMPCPLSSISCRGGCYRSDLKSSKQVVYLRGYLLKVQIYQPFSRAGCVLPWQIKRILVIASRSIKVCSSISQAAAQVEKVFPVLYLCEERPALTNSRRGDILLPFIGGNAPA